MAPTRTMEKAVPPPPTSAGELDADTRLRRLERALAETGLALQRAQGGSLWLKSPALRSIVEELTGDQFDPRAPWRG